jgi:hypothetical protein
MITSLNTEIYTKEKLSKISDVKNNEIVNYYINEISKYVLITANNGRKTYQWKDNNYEFTGSMIQNLILELKKIFIDIPITGDFMSNTWSITIDWN